MIRKADTGRVERFHLERFINIYPHFPSGRAEFDDRSDLLVHSLIQPSGKLVSYESPTRI